ncbi:2-nitropropane dioxygenase [Anaerocolumna cellulosilytica]|uniref:2-nitropropane dioxygenase n=1 Tax=Anaerocolumna cellulosilytica TaxID=433286 RepID=A0A6S6R2V9_9FIRM|nr:PfaD family polyunsaturated fatty acid/polyketide biosynthesis protein [Anaerocolumna cellulosilytica]MBB5196471.1 PfaD family protein [Anaerocolumna cellulosilytica]BCJ94407.1 2-nitropropane dioxygenase [Anaerocolumna cellulosilytica]
MNTGNQISLWIRPEAEELELYSGKDLLKNFQESVYVYEKNGIFFITREGNILLNEKDGYYKLVANDSSYNKVNLGSGEFIKEHQVSYPYVLGGMAQGIASVDLVVAAAEKNIMSFFGTGGLNLQRVDNALKQIKSRIKKDGVYGVNIISANPKKDEEIISLLIQHEVRIIEVAGAVTLTPAIVEYRLQGIHKKDNRIITKNKIFAKISREEVASLFMSPPPEKIITQLLNEGRITKEEARLAVEISVSEDIIAEADSGGHTDNRPALVLYQNMVLLRNQIMKKYQYKHGRIRIGAAGGICTPYTVYAAFSLGVDFVMTGSVNQSCIEAGTSQEVKTILSKLSMSDVANAPSADMFEMGSRVQVMTKGLLFHVKANKLYEVYKNFDSIEQIDSKTRNYLEEKVFKENLNDVWHKTRQFFVDNDPILLSRADKNEKLKMALIFRSYLGLSSKWAQNGEMDKKVDFQVFCGPAMGAFNRWVKDTYLEYPENRRVADVAKNMIYGAMYLKRLYFLSTQCQRIDMNNFQVVPDEKW